MIPSRRCTAWATGPGNSERGVARLKTALDWLVGQVVAIRSRLLLINLIIVMVPVVGIYFARTYERELLKALEQDMQHQAQLLRTLLEQNLDQQGKPRTELVAASLHSLAKRTRTRIRLLDRDGRLIADSHKQGAPEGPEPAVPGLWRRGVQPERRHGADTPSTDPGPLLDRVEVRAARKGQLGTATRVHRRIGRVFLFLTMPVMVQRRVEGVVYLTRSTVPVMQSMLTLRKHLFQVLAGAVALTALLTIFLAGTILRPLTRLSRSAGQISAGDRSISLQLNRRDEIGQLARTFDGLVHKLDNRAQYISEFAANISHEFKTPLASIRGAAELLADGADDDPEARRRFLANIQEDTARLDRLVTRILELSRIEATLELREPLDLGDLVLEVADRFGDHPVEVALEPETLPYLGNAPHLTAALSALVENAVRYSPEGEPVLMRARRHDHGGLTVEVIDRGPGISEANQDKVFQRFFTTEGERGGTGLGLAMVAAVTEAHGGEVTLVSAPGAGATFTMVLPAVKS